MKKLCDELGMMVIAEAVSRPWRNATCLKLGCDLLQGYLFARPGRGFEAPNW